MNCIFFQSHTFCAREIANALKKRSDPTPVIVTIPERIRPEDAHDVFEKIRSNLPGIVISVNNAGYDVDGLLHGLIASSGSIMANWFTDHPLHEWYIARRPIPYAQTRIDFITENRWVALLRDRGYRARFLALGTDPHFFQYDPSLKLRRDIAFVGNSSVEFMDSLISGTVCEELERHAKLVNEALDRYRHNPLMDVVDYVRERKLLWENTVTLRPEQFAYLVEWMVGYLYRRDFITAIAGRYGRRFTCFGDPYWSRFIEEHLVSTDACYYDNLAAYYQSTRINLNINRIQIPTGFTQRIFDCKACGAFVLTNRRDMNKDFFITDGPRRELVEFDSVEECCRLIDYFCAHEEERQCIARAGREKVLANHTYDNRLEEMLTVCRREFGI